MLSTFLSLSQKHQKLCVKQKKKSKEVIYKLGYAFLNTQKVSVQAATYLCLSELWLTKLSPSVLSPFALYLNTNIPKRVGILKSEKEIPELPEDGGGIYKPDLLEYYLARPSQNTNIEIICFAVFSSYYFKSKKNENY